MELSRISRSACAFTLAYVPLLTGCGSHDGTAQSAGSTSTTAGAMSSYPVPSLSSISPSNVAIKSGFFSPQHFGVSQKIAANQGYATDGTQNSFSLRSKSSRQMLSGGLSTPTPRHLRE